MSLGKIVMNYLGQLRVYSLIDLLLLLYAFHVTQALMIGAISLWVGFLAYLEWRHKHENREPIPAVIWMLCFGLGVFLVPSLWSVAFILLCVLYSEKIGGYFGVVSPVLRGVQTLVMVFACTYALTPHLITAGIATAARNLLGDFRDIQKDRRHGMKTIPVLLGLQNDIRHIHLVGVLGTSLLWWSWTSLPFGVLFLVWCIEVSTYYLTAR